MAVTEVFSGSPTISTSEYSLPNGSTSLTAQTTAGVYQVWLDLSALTATEWYVLQIYETVTAGGNKRGTQSVDLIGVNGGGRSPNYVTVPLGLLTGWDFTLTLLKGTARVIPYSVRQLG